MDNQTDNTKRCCSNSVASKTAACSSKKSRIGDDTDSFSFSASGGFIPSTVVQYLGVRSLVRFGATSKSNKAVVDKEVGRREEEIANIKKQLKILMGADHGERGGNKDDDQFSNVTTKRSNMTKAMELSNRALRMIDDEIDFQRKLGTREMFWDDCDYYDSDDFDWAEQDIFYEERKEFVLDACKPFGSLVMLPECFYCPPEGDICKPSDELIKKARKKAVRIWGAEDCMGSVYERNMDDPNWDRLDYEQPFRKFHLSGASFFTYECMEDTARMMAGRGTDEDKMEIEAFRIAARKQVFNTPGARDCLWYTITKADEFLKEALEHSESEGEGEDEYEGETDWTISNLLMQGFDQGDNRPPL